MTPRELLIRLRAAYDDPSLRKSWIIRAAIVFAVTFILGLVIDFTMPFTIVVNFLRTLLMVPSAIGLFVLLYFYSIRLHLYQVRQNADWRPYRTRFSPTWRRRIAAIVVAVLVVMLYGAGQGPGYTFVSTLFLVVVFALLAFIRTTKQEDSREKYDIPDPRDVRYRQTVKKLKKAREESDD